MTNSGIAGLLLIIANIIFSYCGLKNHKIFDGYKFDVDEILIRKDYKRLITAGFLHVSWTHLIFNMVSLWFFCGYIEMAVGEWAFLVIYFAGLIGGNLLALLIHKNHGDYTAVGASGAVSGIIFASLALFPGMGVGLFMLPISIPGWIYGPVYILYSIYGIKSKKDNIGHEAHLGGAVVGMIAALLFAPEAIVDNYVTILIILVPTIVFIYFILTRPQILLVDNLFFKNHHDFYSIDHQYNAEKTRQQKEIDKILDKINQKGINSLSAAEKEKLKKYS